MAKQQIPGWVKFDEWLNQGVKFAPTFASPLPDNKLLAVYTKRADISVPVINRGGVKFYAHPAVTDAQRWQLREAKNVFSANKSGKPAHDAKNNGGFGAQNLTIADAERCATLVENLGLEGDQFGENEYSMPDYGIENSQSTQQSPLPNSAVLYRAYTQKRREQYPTIIVPPIYGQYGSFTH